MSASTQVRGSSVEPRSDRDGSGGEAAISRRTRVRLPSLVAGLTVYGLFGDPLPNVVSLWIVALSVLVGVQVVLDLSRAKRLPSPAVRLLALGLLATAAGLARPVVLDPAISTREMIEDLLPHVALLSVLALCLLRLPPPSAKASRWTVLSLAFAGGALASRFLLTAPIDTATLGLALQDFDGFQRLNFDPLVLFAGVIGPFLALAPRSFSPRRSLGLYLIVSALGAWATVVALASGAASLSRGMLALLFAGWATAGVLLSRRSIVRLLVAFAGASLALAFLLLGSSGAGGSEESVVAVFAERHRELGANGRVEEFYAAVETLADPRRTLTGEGWGALIDVGTYGRPVTFLHNAVFYYAVKAGVPGVVFIAMALVAFGAVLRNAYNYSAPVSAALGAAGANALLLQPTFKSIGFALLVLAVGRATIDRRSVPRVME